MPAPTSAAKRRKRGGIAVVPFTCTPTLKAMSEAVARAACLRGPQGMSKDPPVIRQRLPNATSSVGVPAATPYPCMRHDNATQMQTLTANNR